MNLTSAVFYSSHPLGRSRRGTGLGNQVVANDEHIYGDWAHGTLDSVRYEGGSEVCGAFELQYAISFTEARTK